MSRTSFTRWAVSWIVAVGAGATLCLATFGAGAALCADNASRREAALRARVEELYTALQTNDWTKVEALLTDDSKEVFRRQTKSGVKGFEIKSLTLDPDGRTATAVAEILVFSPNAPGPLPIQKRSRWRLVHPAWYLELPKSDPNLLQSIYTAPPRQAYSLAPLATSKDLKFESTWCGLGELHQDQTKVASFAFKNISDHVVSLVDMQLGCECLALKTQQREFKPGESGTLEFVFDPSTMPVAVRQASNNTVLLKTEPGDAYVKLTIAAMLVPGNANAAKPPK